MMKAVYLSGDLHRRLKLEAARRGVPLRRLVEDHLRPLARRALEDVRTSEVTAAAAGGGAFDFLGREEEGIYVPTDGRPIR
jgi:plasmid stability protein